LIWAGIDQGQRDAASPEFALTGNRPVSASSIAAGAALNGVVTSGPMFRNLAGARMVSAAPTSEYLDDFGGTLAAVALIARWQWPLAICFLIV
jgi:hypothetical protein